MASNKRLILIISLVAAVCLAVVGATVAYYQGQTVTADNQFKVGAVDVSVPEVFPSIEENKDNAVKVVQLENTGTVDAYLRAMIVPTFRGEDGSYACDVDYSTVSAGYITVTDSREGTVYTLNLAQGWESSWHFSPTDNVFYFREIVPPFEKNLTTYLLESVSKNKNNWEDLNIDILADAVQTEGETVREHLKNNWGVTHISNTGTLHWD